jgi:hypothetical protein
MSDVFISFIHEEAATAEALQEFVSEMLGGKANTFLSSDKFQIYAGEPWLEKIMSELSTAKVVLLLLSHRSVGRPWVNFEAGSAWLTKKIIPICIKEMDKDNLPKPYSHLTSINLKYKEDQLFLIRSIAHHLELEAPEIATKFGGSLAGLYGTENMKLVERQEECLKTFNDELRAAEHAETLLEKYEDRIRKGEMVKLRDLAKTPGDPKDRVK